MCGFTLWIGERWRAWLQAQNRAANDRHIFPCCHASFDAWLQNGGAPPPCARAEHAA